MYAIPSTSLSTVVYMHSLPILEHRIIDLDTGRYRRQIEHLEYHWGLRKGELDLASPLNHIQLRADMAERLSKDEWVFIPTPETLKEMLKLVEHNKTASLPERKNCLEELSTEEHEYDVVPLFSKKRTRPSLYAALDGNVRTIQAPYRNLPRIRSQAHPFLVAYMASEKLDTIAPLVMPLSKAEPLALSVGRIVRAWWKQPPDDFLVGPDVWKEHRHPLSDDGTEACNAIDEEREGNALPPVTRARARKTTQAPCRQPKATTSPTPYTKRKPLPPRARGSALPRPGRQSGGGVGCAPSDVAAWLCGIERSPGQVPQPTWIQDEEVQDADLARYRREDAREVRNALDPHTNVMLCSGLVCGQGTDWSGLSSNNLAMYVHGACLLGKDPFGKAAF
ncbi:hypothetical protein K523DRAFT_415439 [Schizophyllum commune Tattone D]|nr:hypothetical protein K523DRAFT_415439 [Schizophyllum commune Tattone D]